MTMNEILFEVDEEGREFCLNVASEMVKTFGIPMSEAVGRINKHWQGQKIIGTDIVYHRLEEEWAKIIYYEDGTWWWIEKWMAENTPKAKPYP